MLAWETLERSSLSPKKEVCCNPAVYVIQSNCVSETETHKRGAYSLFWFLVPVAAPKILSLQRTQSTSALIEWEALRLEDLRGNLTSYTIVYFALSNGCPSLTGSADSSSL